MVYYMVLALICLCTLFSICTSQDYVAWTGYKGRYGQEPPHYEIVVPQKVSRNGEFVSNTIPHHYKLSYYANRKRGEMGPDDMVHYLVPISGETHHLELEPNHILLSPGAVIESHQGGETFEEKANLRKVRDVQCHFGGRVRNHEGSSVALSTCYGLSGYIRTKRGYYLIEPAAGHNALSDDQHPHLVYQRHHNDPGGTSNCGAKGRMLPYYRAKKDDEYFPIQKNVSNMYTTENYTDLNLELLVVLDKTFIDYHRELDIESYVLTVMNMAYDLFHDASLGKSVNLVIVRIIRLESEEDEMNLRISKNPEATLNFFRRWQAKLNPGDDSHPNHHDLALLITRIDICESEQTCGLLGTARLAGVCDPHNQAALCQDSGLILGFVITHEIGHTLGMMHDTLEESGCNATLTHAVTTVMGPDLSMKIGQWSPCSEKYLDMFVDSGFGKCLLDTPTDHPFEFMDMLPGVMYGPEFQCQDLLGPLATVCDAGLKCDELLCQVPRHGCIGTGLLPAPGTTCGEEKWCYRSECLEVGDRPGSVDGGWGPWSDWSECSRTCGSGVYTRTRRCDSPVPSGSGKFCKGNDREHHICSTEPCPMNQPSFRDVQCLQFNEWVYPEDGRTHTWNAYKMPHENPCALFCWNENHVIASLQPRVIDGTSCLKGMRDICIAGKCKEIPCDLQIESNAIEDVCGLCHGDGTTCMQKSGEKFFSVRNASAKTHDVVKFFDVPAGTQNIKVEEALPTKSKIQVRNRDGSEVFVKGYDLGMYAVPGSKAWLGNIRMNQEALHIPGPISEEITIWVLVYQNTTMTYTMAVKTDKRVGEFNWDYIKWSPCSAICGPGTEQAIPRCVEKEAGLVEDKYCKVIRPKIKIRPCEVAPCLPRWMISDWQRCICDSDIGHQIRLVKCMKPSGEQEWEFDIISDNECSNPKPKEEEPCECHKPYGKPEKRRRRHIFHRQNHPSKIPSKNKYSDKILSRIRTSKHDYLKPFRREVEPGCLNVLCSQKHLQKADMATEEIEKFNNEKGKFIIDRMCPSDIRLTITANRSAGEVYPEGFEPKNNEKYIEVVGHKALTLLDKLQKERNENKVPTKDKENDKVR